MLKSLSLINDLFTVGVASMGILPYVITAFMLGLVLAQIYMTLLRSFESKLLSALHTRGAVGQENSVALSTLVTGGKMLAFVCFLLGSPSASLYRWVSHEIIDARAAGGFVPKKRGEKAQKIRMDVTPETKLYIKEDALSYVEERGIKFSTEQWMNVVYTAIACGIAWFILLYTLDDILALVM